MSWAARRRFLILAIIAVVVLIIVAISSYVTFHRAPSCSDGIQNQGEVGIDCGGPCPYLCQSQVQAPVVSFTQAFSSAPGQTDVIAYIDNQNQGAYAVGVPYQISLYAPNQTLGAPTQTGTVDLPPGASVPVFIPNIDSKNITITAAFLTIDPATIRWQAGTDTRVVPTVANQTVGGTASSPRITATLTDPSALPLSNVKVIIALFNAAGNIITASQTVVRSIPGQGSAIASFTWNAPFSAPIARIDVLPVIPLVSP